MSSPEPIYRQYLNVQPPERFLQTVDAYLEFLRQTGDWSGRRLLNEAGVSAGYLSSFKVRLRTFPNYSPAAYMVDAIVAVLNKNLPGDQQWPHRAALEAANVDPKYIRDQVIPIEVRKPSTAQKNNDTFPLFPAKLALPVLAFDKMQKDGLGDAANQRSVFQISSNMALVTDTIPGYAPQRDGDWAIIQSPDVTMPQGVQPWALIRDNGHLRAIPHQQASKRQIVAWILGTICLDPS